MILKLNIFVRSCGLFLLIAMSTQFMQAEDYFPTMYSVVKTYNGRYLVHDTAYNRTLELSQTSLFSGGNSQLKITTSATSISGKVISLPVMANEVASINKSRLLLLYSGFNSGILLIDTNGNTIDSDTSLSARGDSLKLMGTFGNSLLIKAGNSVFAIESISDSIKSTLVQENVFAIDHTQKGIVCIVKKAGGLSLRTIDTSGKVLLDFPFTPMGSSYRVIASKQAILVLSTSTGYSTTGFLFTLRDNKQKMLFFPCSPSLCTMWEVDDQQLLAWIAEGSDGTYSLSIQQSDGNINKLTFPLFCSNPFSIIYQDNQLYILFSNSLAICDSKSSPAFTTVSSIAQLRNIISDYASVSEINGRTIISDNNHNIFLQSTHDSLWWIRGFADNVGKYIATLAIVGFLFIFYRRYSRQNKFLEAGLELSGMGLIIYLDAEGRVKKLNTLAKTILGISSDVPLNRPIRYYCLKPSLNELLSFIETTLEFRQPAQSRISIGEHEYAKEYIWSSTPLFGFAGNYAGCILSGLDITEELEKKRLTNWAQLAHDMQTNLSIILLNAQQLTIEEPANIERQRKILSQINLLVQRVHDIVTVGREDKAHFSLNDAAVICNNVVNEFDTSLFPYVTLKSSGKNIMFSCDPIKLTRGIRNAVENGIRALQKKEGTVELSCIFDEHFVYFKIKDSGIGMDDFTRINMMKPYFTTKRSHGGYGIGTMVMQKVAEQHNGRIEVLSEPGNGTIVTFIIPRDQQ